MLKGMATSLNRYRFRTRVVLAYIVLSLFTTVILSITIYQALAGNVMSRIGENSVLSLKQSANAADTIYRQINTVMSHMLVEQDMQNFVYAQNEDKVIIYRASLELNKLLSVYPFIQSIELYNAQAGMYYNSLRLNVDEQPLYQKRAESFYHRLETDRFYILPRQIDIVKGTNPMSYQVLSFIFRPYSTIENKAMVVMNLDLGYIRENILKYSDSSNDSQTFMLDADNMIIAHNEPGMFMKDAVNYGFSRFFSGSNSEGYETETINNRKYLISFTKSSVYNWYFINIKPYDTIIGGLTHARNIVLIASIATFLVALAISIMIMRSIYNPFLLLLDKLGGVPAKSSDMETLTKAISQWFWYKRSHETHCQELFLHDLLRGAEHSSLDEESHRLMSQQFSSSRFCVLLFALDKYEGMKSNGSAHNNELLQFNIANIIREALFPISAGCTCISTGDGKIVALCATVQEAQVAASIREIQDVTQSLFGSELSAAIGTTVFTLSDVKSSYASALKCIQYRLFEGHGCCLDDVGIQPYINNDASYPYELEEEIMKVLQHGTSKELENHIGEFIETLRNASCENVYNYAIQLAYAYLKLSDRFTMARNYPYNLINQIRVSDTVEDIGSHLRIYADELLRTLKSGRLPHNYKKHRSTIDGIKNYIEAHFDDANLSIEVLAEMTNLSPEYIRKVFKQVEGNSFSHYLSSVRLQKAREMLIGTEIPAMQIGEKVGLYNTTYFITLFRKTYGLTPAAFRKQLLKDKPS